MSATYVTVFYEPINDEVYEFQHVYDSLIGRKSQGQLDDEINQWRFEYTHPSAVQRTTHLQQNNRGEKVRQINSWADLPDDPQLRDLVTPINQANESGIFYDIKQLANKLTPEQNERLKMYKLSQRVSQQRKD